DYQLVADLEAMTWRHPERERLWRQLALALYRSGRQVEALRVLARCRRAMGGVAEVLAPESVRLERAIARQDPTLEDGELTD
ncbi:MAG: BTAD domain-containing putative transcriptional regulator, partial [Acidimicrobiales bacterium]